MANLERLPPELLIATLSCCQSLEDLRSFISASPACFRVFSLHRKYIVPPVWRNAIGTANYRELLAIFHVPPVITTNGGDDITTNPIHTMRPYLEHYFSTRPLEDFYDPTHLARMCRLHNTISRLTDLYFLHASQVLVASRSSNTVSTPTTLVTPLSTTERTRIQRAFLRYELYSRLFPHDKASRKSFIQGKDQFHLFIRRMKPWEIEESSCIHHYLTSLAAGYLTDIEDQFVDAFRSCPGAQLLPPKLQPRKRTRPWDDDYSMPLPSPKHRKLLCRPDISTKRMQQEARPRRQPDIVSAKRKIAKKNQEKRVPCSDLELVGLGLIGNGTFRGSLPKFTSHLASLGLESSVKLMDASGDPKLRRDLIYETKAAFPVKRNLEFLPEALRHSPWITINHNAGSNFYSFFTADITGRDSSAASKSWRSWESGEEDPERNGENEEEDPARPNSGYRGFGHRLSFMDSQTRVYQQIDTSRYDPLREMGYVFWDKGRLGTRNAQHNLHRACAGLLGDEDRARRKKRSVWSRETVEARLEGVRIPASEWRRLVEEFTSDLGDDCSDLDTGSDRSDDSFLGDSE